jgi:hypothetical protein
MIQERPVRNEIENLKLAVNNRSVKREPGLKIISDNLTRPSEIFMTKPEQQINK